MADTHYLEPIGSFTNRAFADFPLDEALVTEIFVAHSPEPIRAWEVNEFQLQQVKASKANSQLEFNEYVRHGNSKFVKKVSPEHEKEKGIQVVKKMAKAIKASQRR